MLLAAGFLQLIWICDGSLDKPGIRERHPVCFVSSEVSADATKEQRELRPRLDEQKEHDMPRPVN